MKKQAGLSGRRSVLIIGLALVVQGFSPIFADRAVQSRPAQQAKAKVGSAAPAAAKKSKEDRAIDLVWKRPEVKKWLKQFPGGVSKLGGHAAATADLDKGEIYSVHVYEDLPDHTATFNWYSVDLKTGKVTKQM